MFKRKFKYECKKGNYYYRLMIYKKDRAWHALLERSNDSFGIWQYMGGYSGNNKARVKAKPKNILAGYLEDGYNFEEVKE